MSTVIIIPARLNSSRLARKILLDLNGQTVIEHVFKRCSQVSSIDGVHIAVDSEETMEICKKFTSNVHMTSTKHESGTDRIAEVAKNIQCDNVLNVQGDEPFINVDLLNRIVETLESSSNSSIDIVTACCPIESSESFLNPNNVKVVLDNFNNALYFSRAAIPFSRDNTINLELSAKHIGVYGYRKQSLLKFVSAPQNVLERVEKLEQLRALSMGLKIQVLRELESVIGIDTLEDYEQAKLFSL
ncbi:MAG: 3-deoxy-manno-octulosonate cytidylyltransferase (CMP-KDO synthetase) [Cyclobacteriaceae bacterium]|jgi:3-deoxy-manno-octulosonate cytidylyltransferase (CMP-KDO synthetase)